MFDTLLTNVQPHIVEALFYLVMSILGGIGGGVGLALRKVLLTKQAKDMLHSAIETGVGLIIGQLIEVSQGAPEGSLVPISEKDGILDTVVDYVKRSIPGSLKRLKPSDDLIKEIAVSKINQALY